MSYRIIRTSELITRIILGQTALAGKLFAQLFPHYTESTNGIELHHSLRDESKIRGMIGVRDAVNPMSVDTGCWEDGGKYHFSQHTGTVHRVAADGSAARVHADPVRQIAFPG